MQKAHRYTVKASHPSCLCQQQLLLPGSRLPIHRNVPLDTPVRWCVWKGPFRENGEEGGFCFCFYEAECSQLLWLALVVTR